MEKLSEQHIRLAKIEQLRAKILKEINKELHECDMESAFVHSMRHSDYESLKRIAFECLALLNLRRYIQKSNLFMGYEKSDGYEDCIVYTIPIKNINIWLLDDFNFARQFVFDAKEHNYNTKNMLNERYFAHEFLSIFDMVIYKDKIEMDK